MTSNWLHKKDLMWENFNSSSHGSYYSYFIHTYWLFTWNRRAGGIFKRKRTKLLTDFALRLALICYSNRCLKVLFQCTKSTAIQTLVFCSWIRRMQIRPQLVWYSFETWLCNKFQFLDHIWVKPTFGGKFKFRSVNKSVEVVRFSPLKWTSLRFGTRNRL